MTVTHPVLGALAVVVKPGRTPGSGHVILVQRGKQPDKGLWGFPGGHVEVGETAIEAAQRELLEETGVASQALGYLTNIDLVHHDDSGRVTAHYLLAAVLCRHVSGEPNADDDAMDARWVDCDDIRAESLPLSDSVGTVMELALARSDVVG